MANTDGALPADTSGFRSDGVYVPGVGTVAASGGAIALDSSGTPYAPQNMSLTQVGGVKVPAAGVVPVVQATANAAVAAGTGTTPVVVKASAGYLKLFVVTTTATAAMSFYDNASAASGTVLYTTAANIAAGTIIVLDMPFLNGLTLSQASGSAAVTIAYS